MMIKNVLNVVGWYSVVTALYTIAIRVGGSDAFVQEYAGASRRLGPVYPWLAFGLIALALATIIARLDALLAKPKE